MRGENKKPNVIFTIEFGSPPHAWGKWHYIRYMDDMVRFTPTCVGKILLKMKCSRHWTVHPHMRGENNSVEEPASIFAGSPPHAWGKLIALNALGAPLRFTPTCVGKMPPG